MAKKTFEEGRNARTGRFVPVEKAKSNPDKYVVERIPKPGFGDTKGTPQRPRPPRQNQGN